MLKHCLIEGLSKAATKVETEREPLRTPPRRAGVDTPAGSLTAPLRFLGYP